MSFSVEFAALQADAVKIVEQEHLPEPVKDFIGQALAAFPLDAMVRVKAVGHLFSGKDYQRSNADIVVEQVMLRKPKE